MTFLRHAKTERILDQHTCITGNVKDKPFGKKENDTRWKPESTQKTKESWKW